MFRPTEVLTTLAATMLFGLITAPALGEPEVQTVAVSPGVVFGGEPATITVTLNNAAPEGGTEVKLTLNAPFTPTGTSSLTVPAGQTSASVQVQTTAVQSTPATSQFAAYRSGSNARQNATLKVEPIVFTL